MDNLQKSPASELKECAEYATGAPLSKKQNETLQSPTGDA